MTAARQTILVVDDNVDVRMLMRAAWRGVRRASMCAPLWAAKTP